MSDFEKVIDSGQRRQFATGSVRDVSAGKGRFDLISPLVMMRFAKHFENGAKKYGDRNWEKGQPMSVFLDSAMRHTAKFLAGLRDEDHLAAAMWNLHAIMHFEELYRGGDESIRPLMDLPWMPGAPE